MKIKLKLTITTVFILCTFLVQRVHPIAPSYDETFTLQELTPERHAENGTKTSIFQKYNLLTLDTRFKMTKFSQMATLVQQLDYSGIKFQLEINYALGTINQYKFKDLNLDADGSNTGSFFTLRIPKNQSFGTLELVQAQEFTRKIALLSSGAFNLAAEDVLRLRFHTETSTEFFFWNAIPNEILCSHHFVNLRKLINVEPRSFYNTFFTTDMLDESYSALRYTLSYQRKGELQLNVRLQYLANQLRFKRKMKNSITPAFPFTKINFLKWKNNQAAEQSSVKYRRTEESTTQEAERQNLKQLRVRLRSIGQVKPVLNHEFKVFNFISGPAQKPQKTYNLSIGVDLDEVRMEMNQDLDIQATLVFDYTQRPWISTLKIQILDSEGRFLSSIPITGSTFDIRKSNEDDQKNPHPQMTIELNFRIPSQFLKQKIEVVASINCGISLFGYEQIVHEQERGAYFPPTLVLAKFEHEQIGGERLFRIEPLLIDTKRMDNTYVFSTLTLTFIVFTILYTGMGFWGLKNTYPE